MKYAKLWLKKYIKYKHDHLDENKLNRAIINLSHRVYKSHGRRGHNVRQSIRSQLVDYSRTELARYGVAFERPLRVSYKHRAPRISVHRTGRSILYILWFLIKLIGIVILGLIIWYLLFH